MDCATICGAASVPMFPFATTVCAAETDVSPKPTATTAASTPVLSRFKLFLPRNGVCGEPRLGQPVLGKAGRHEDRRNDPPPCRVPGTQEKARLIKEGACLPTLLRSTTSASYVKVP